MPRPETDIFDRLQITGQTTVAGVFDGLYPVVDAAIGRVPSGGTRFQLTYGIHTPFAQEYGIRGKEVAVHLSRRDGPLPWDVASRALLGRKYWTIGGGDEAMLVPAEVETLGARLAIGKHENLPEVLHAVTEISHADPDARFGSVHVQVDADQRIDELDVPQRDALLEATSRIIQGVVVMERLVGGEEPREALTGLFDYFPATSRPSW